MRWTRSASLKADILDAAVVTRSEGGRVDLRQTHQVAAGEGVVAGGTIGFVAGMLLGGPVGGALLGMLGGGVWGARDTGVPDARLRELGESLAPGGALLCALVQADGAAAVREELAPYGEVADADAPAAPVAAPVEQIRDAAERQRQPERQQPVRERRHDRLVRARPGERQQAREAGFDEAEAARREGDQREQHPAGVGEDDERRIRPGADRGETAEEPEIVESRLGDDRAEGERPPRAERML